MLWSYWFWLILSQSSELFSYQWSVIFVAEICKKWKWWNLSTEVLWFGGIWEVYFWRDEFICWGFRRVHTGWLQDDLTKNWKLLTDSWISFQSRVLSLMYNLTMIVRWYSSWINWQLFHSQCSIRWKFIKSTQNRLFHFAYI